MDSRVLLVHRDPGILRAMEADLLSEGLEVHTASNGSEGWKILQNTRPGLVVSDVEVGALDDFAFVSRLRQEPAGKTAALILIDGNEATGRSMRAMQAGADRPSAKPREASPARRGGSPAIWPNWMWWIWSH